VLSQAPGVDTNSPEFEQAQQVCGQILSGLGGGQ
jgi:hypothetical protein